MQREKLKNYASFSRENSPRDSVLQFKWLPVRTQCFFRTGCRLSRRGGRMLVVVAGAVGESSLMHPGPKED